MGNRTYGINKMAKRIINKFKFRGQNVHIIYRNWGEIEIDTFKYRIHKKMGRYMDELHVNE